MIVKEFRQLRRDRRTLAMMIALPLLLLVVFGYAADFDVEDVPTRVVGPEAAQVADQLDPTFHVDRIDPTGDRHDAEVALRDGDAAAVFVAEGGTTTALLDGSDLFTAKAARSAIASMREHSDGTRPLTDEVLYNEDLSTSPVIVPGLAGLILLFIATVVTSLGVVRERQAGTLEQLAVMPLRPRDVFLGKIAPYFAVATVDLMIVVVAGRLLFDVPFRGSILVFGLGSLLFLFVTLGLGVLISSVSESQGQAIQLAIMMLLPQVLLSGLIFPIASMAAGVRWIAYLLPLTYFVEIARGVMLRGAPLDSLWQPFVALAVLGTGAVSLATTRFRRTLAPAPPKAAKPSRAERVERAQAAGDEAMAAGDEAVRPVVVLDLAEEVRP
jgi:ABC-2 type transport system permease protein